MPETSTVRVREQLQDAILEGVLKPGERLRAEALAQGYGTSRTPVRALLEPAAAARAAQVAMRTVAGIPRAFLEEMTTHG